MISKSEIKRYRVQNPGPDTMSAMLNHAEALHIAIAAINYAIKSLPVDSVEATKLEGKLTQIKELVAE